MDFKNTEPYPNCIHLPTPNCEKQLLQNIYMVISINYFKSETLELLRAAAAMGKKRIDALSG